MAKPINLYRRGDISNAERRRMLAEALTAQSLQPRIPQQQGALVAPMHWGEGLAQLGQAAVARYATKQADDAEAEEENALRAQFGLPPKQTRQQMMATQLSGEQPQARERTIPSIGLDSPELEMMLYAQNPGAYLDILTRKPQEQKFGFENVGGTLLRTDPRAGTAEPVYQGQKGPAIGNVDPAKFTPESVASFSQSGDYGALKPIEAGGRSLSDLLSTEQGLRKEFTSLSGDFRTLSQGLTNIQSAAANPSAAGDLSIVFSFMKILDPRSTVREGEAASAQNAAGVPDRIRAMYNNVLSGQLLAEPQRADFVAQAQALFEARKGEQQQLVRQYSDIATRAGVPVENVIVDAFRPGELQSLMRPQPSGPPPGVDPELWAVMTEEERALWR